jgi:hypothetical protein
MNRRSLIVMMAVVLSGSVVAQTPAGIPSTAASAATVTASGDDGPTPVPVTPLPELPAPEGLADGFDRLGDRAADLPQPESAVVVSDDAWQDVPGLPVDVRQTPALAAEVEAQTPAPVLDDSRESGSSVAAVPAVWTGSGPGTAAVDESSSELPVEVTVHDPAKPGDIVLSVAVAESEGEGDAEPDAEESAPATPEDSPTESPSDEPTEEPDPVIRTRVVW